MSEQLTEADVAGLTEALRQARGIAASLEAYESVDGPVRSEMRRRASAWLDGTLMLDCRLRPTAESPRFKNERALAAALALLRRAEEYVETCEDPVRAYICQYCDNDPHGPHREGCDHPGVVLLRDLRAFREAR